MGEDKRTDSSNRIQEMFKRYLSQRSSTEYWDDCDDDDDDNDEDLNAEF